MQKRSLCVLLAILIAAMLFTCALAERAGYATLNQVQQLGGELTMYVNLRDKQGKAIQDGNAANYKVIIDGEEYPVTSVNTTEGVHYVFCVDVSLTMKKDTMVAPLKQALKQFVQGISEDDTVSIITFGETVDTLTENSWDKSVINQAIDNINADQNMTALYKGVLDSVELANKYGGRSAVIVFTDGKDDPTEEMKKYTKESIFNEVIATQVPLYCIGLNDNNGVDEMSLKEFASTTGGAQFVTSGAQVDKSIASVKNLIRSAVQLRTNITNTRNRNGSAISTFKVEYTDKNKNVASSNLLKTTIDWGVVPNPTPVPTAAPTPSPTPAPEMYLELNESEILFTGDSEINFGCTVQLKQGTIDKNSLKIYVDDVRWNIASISQNGNNYVLSVSGSVIGNPAKLKVQAKISDELGSNYEYIQLIQPTAAPTEVPLSMSLALNNRSIMNVEGATATIKGNVTVLSGNVQIDDLHLYVNDEEWTTAEFVKISSGYEFSATGELHGVTDDYLNVSVRTSDGIATNTAEQPLVTPTAAPTEAPVNRAITNIEIDNADSMPIVAVNGTLNVTGQVDVQGDVTENDLALIVNGEDVQAVFRSDGSGVRYEFEAEIIVTEEMASNAKAEIRAQIIDTDIYSRTRNIVLPQPTATPVPQMEIHLAEAETLYAEGQDVVISGTINSTTEMDPETMVLYVQGTKWDDVEFTARDDGSYGFTARSSKLAYNPESIKSLDVKVKVNGVNTNTETIALVTPTPSPAPTAAPTPEPPKAVVAIKTAAPGETADANAEKTQNAGFIAKLRDDGILWYLIAGVVLVIALVVVLIVVKKRKSGDSAMSMNPSVLTHDTSENDDVNPTIRDDACEATVNSSTVSGVYGQGADFDSDFVGGAPVQTGESSGTIRLDDHNDTDAGEYGGTVSLGEDEDGIDLTIDVQSKSGNTETRNVFLRVNGEIIGGRRDGCDFVINDAAVSSRHFSLIYDGTDVYIQDMQSSNGTRIGSRKAKKLTANEMTRINNGDVVYVGETSLTFHFEIPSGE